jgi:hypothetical protein
MRDALIFAAGLLAGVLMVALVDEAGRPDYPTAAAVRQ